MDEAACCFLIFAIALLLALNNWENESLSNILVGITFSSTHPFECINEFLKLNTKVELFFLDIYTWKLWIKQPFVTDCEPKVLRAWLTKAFGIGAIKLLLMAESFVETKYGHSDWTIIPFDLYSTLRPLFKKCNLEFQIKKTL